MFVVILAVLLASCGGGPEVLHAVAPPPLPPPPVLINSVVARISNSKLTVGDTVRATAVAISTVGDTIRDRPVLWFVHSGGSAATVTADGLVTAIGGGTAVIAGAIDGATGTAPLAVLDPATIPVSMEVRVATATLNVGDTTRATATVFNVSKGEIPGAPVTWRVQTGASVVSVSSDGLITAIAPGLATVEALSDSVRASVNVSVLASGSAVTSVVVDLPTRVLAVNDTVRATAVALDAANGELPGKTPSWRISTGSAVASVSSTGLVTASSAGAATVEATIDGVAGVATLTVNSSLPSEVALPQLPTTYLDFPYPTSPGRQILVRQGDNLQSALNSAKRGDEIILQAGGRWTGNFLLPEKPGTVQDGWIVVRGENQAALPPIGTRILPTDAATLPKLVTPNANQALGTAPSASGWRLVGIEITVDSLFNGQHNGLVLLGDGTAKQNHLSLVPSDLVLDRVYIHGLTTTNLKRCVALNSARTAITDSYLFDCHGKGFDSQAIGIWNGPGPFKIVNNTLAGAGENIMIGGSDPSIRDLIPSDIEFRRNYVWTPASWKNVWTKKNLFETKNAQRLLIEGNILDGSWTDGQVGVGVVFKSANQSGRCTWCASRDITIRYNVIRNVAQSLALTGREGGNPYAVGERLARVLVEHNLFEGLHVAPYLGDPRLFLLVNNGSDLTVRRNTWDANPGAILTFITFGASPAATNFVFENNITTMGKYGMLGEKVPQGDGAFAASVNGIGRFSSNVIYGPSRPGYSAANVLVPTIAQARSMPNVGADRVKLASYTQLIVEK